VLNLCDNQINRVSHSILSLVHLQKLYLSGNHICDDDLSIVNLISLKSLKCINFLNEIPMPILYLPDIII
jgi:Leucine-rich repeat (LRR) protein